MISSIRIVASPAGGGNGLCCCQCTQELRCFRPNWRFAGAGLGDCGRCVRGRRLGGGGGQGVSSSGAHDTVTGPLCRRGRRLGGTMVQSSRGRRHGAGGVNYTNKGFSETYISISVCSRQIFAVNFYGESHPVSPRHYLTLLTSLPHYHRTSSNIASPRACFPPYGYERVATCPPRTCTPRSRNRHPRRPHAGLRGRGGGAPARTRRCADRSCGQ